MRKLVSFVVLSVAAMACAPAAAPSPSATVAASASAAASPPATATPAPAPVTVKFGQIGTVSDGAIFIANAKGYFKEQGITLDELEKASRHCERDCPMRGCAGRERIIEESEYGPFRIRRYADGIVWDEACFAGRPVIDPTPVSALPGVGHGGGVRPVLIRRESDDFLRRHDERP